MLMTNPWDNIELELVREDKEFHYEDLDVHIIYVVLGEALAVLEDDRSVLKQSDFIILNNKKLRIELNNSKVVHFRLKYNSNSMEKTRYSFYFQGDSQSVGRNIAQTFSGYLQQLIDLFVFRDNKKYSFVLHSYYGIIAYLEEYFSTIVKISNKGTTREKILELQSYIDNNYYMEIRLSDISNQFFISEQYLSKIFYEETGKTFTAYLIERRLEQVKRILLNTDLSITDAAYSSGFNNVNSFNKLFKKHFHTTPSLFREQNRKQEEVHQMMEGDQSEMKQLLTSGKRHGVDQITIDLSGEAVNYQSELMINLGYAGDLLLSDLSDQMTRIQELPFRYGRTWGIINDEILQREGPIFDFSKVDRIIDTILSAELIPFLDIGFLGKMIATSYSTIKIVKNFKLPSYRMEDVLERYEALFNHFLDRYGAQEVSRWMLEMWKPNPLVVEHTRAEESVMVHTDNGMLNLLSNNGYITFFGSVKQIVKKLFPAIRYGGCGLSIDIEDSSYKVFLTDWFKDRKNSPDFISIKTFQITLHNQNAYTGKLKNPIDSNENFILEQVSAFKETLKAINDGIPLVISELNVTTSSRDGINDTGFKSTYLIKNLMDIFTKCSIVGYWYYSDATVVDASLENKEIFGGAGLLTRNGIAKNSFTVFHFLSILSENIIYIGNGVCVTKTNMDVYHVLIYNFSQLNSNYYYNYNNVNNFNEESLYSIFTSKRPSEIEIKLNNISALREQVHIKEYRLDSSDNDLAKEIYQLGHVKKYTPELVGYLESKISPKINMYCTEIVDKSIVLNKKLQVHSLIYLEIT
nr:helix-turn-helix domain-containing protein [uncultured Trichococcus sp.]